MNALGWAKGQINPQNLTGDAVFFYVHDFQTGWIWSCSIQRETFLETLNKSKATEPDKIMIIFHCCDMINLGAASKTDLPSAKETELAYALTFYFGITKSFELSEQATKCNHFFVIHYEATKTLRPFAMRGLARQLMPVNEVKLAIGQVVSLDAKNHPDWIANLPARQVP